ncbi:MAG TPA: bifunctional oligoribonuclease/PAP phosphatase NrnA [Longimicrobiales bacterium]|nr:bifunctional oligoribonuclease/PAP phosphatase NrnA [Longimicrobiales bacterium]
MKWLETPSRREEPIRRILAELEDAQDIVLTTHVNADGDGTGSQAAFAALLQARGKHVHIVNPTAYPEAFRYLLDEEEMIVDLGDARAEGVLATCDTLCVLDTGEWSRIGRVGRALSDRRILVIDHHLPGEDPIDGTDLRDPAACATGELVYDLFTATGTDWSRQALHGIYAAILTDTGSFRFANATPRAHAIAADLIARGVDPEEMYRRIYATVPLRRIALLRHALERLDVDPVLPITWITIESGIMDSLGCTSDDLDGVIEHARSIEGTEVALLFRATADGSTKVSLRSSGAVDVNAVARRFGGGGHAKASGALMGKPLQEARHLVLEAVREAVRRELGERGAAVEPPEERRGP